MDAITTNLSVLTLGQQCLDKGKKRRRAGVIMLRFDRRRKTLQVMLLQHRHSYERKDNHNIWSYDQPAKEDRDQFRRNFGKWSVPGGGVEDNETDDEAAFRELEEETGRSFQFFEARVLDRVKDRYGNSYVIAVANRWVPIRDMNLQKSEINSARWWDLDKWHNTASSQYGSHNCSSRFFSEHDYTQYGLTT